MHPKESVVLIVEQGTWKKQYTVKDVEKSLNKLGKRDHSRIKRILAVNIGLFARAASGTGVDEIFRTERTSRTQNRYSLFQRVAEKREIIYGRPVYLVR